MVLLRESGLWLGASGRRGGQGQLTDGEAWEMGRNGMARSRNVPALGWDTAAKKRVGPLEWWIRLPARSVVPIAGAHFPVPDLSYSGSVNGRASQML